MSKQVAVVTGASRGIGRATALGLSQRGVRVALCGRPSPAMRESLEMVRKIDEQAIQVDCDVSDEPSVAEAARSVLERFGAPSIVVNNAGIVHRGPTVEQTALSDWQRVLDVNLTGAFLVTRAFLPSMRLAGRGRFVHVGSISSTIGCPQNASYAASKWGLVGFSKSLAEELRALGMVSVCVLPGSVDTDMLVGSGFEPAMSADDVARTIAFLALDAAFAVTGSAVELFG